jgi:hypothetical protein
MLAFVFIVLSFGLLYGVDEKNDDYTEQNDCVERDKFTVFEYNLNRFEDFLNRQFPEKTIAQKFAQELFKIMWSLALSFPCSFAQLGFAIHLGTFDRDVNRARIRVQNMCPDLHFNNRSIEIFRILAMASVVIFGTIFDAGIIYVFWSVYEKFFSKTDVCDIKKDLITQYLQSLGDGQMNHVWSGKSG